MKPIVINMYKELVGQMTCTVTEIIRGETLINDDIVILSRNHYDFLVKVFEIADMKNQIALLNKEDDLLFVEMWRIAIREEVTLLNEYRGMIK